MDRPQPVDNPVPHRDGLGRAGGEDGSPQVLVRLYGGPAVEVDGTPLDLGPPRQQALFAVLALSANRLVPVDRIIDAVWGENPPRTSAHAVQVYVSDLRRTFLAATGRPLIVTRRPGYLLEAADDEVDVRILESRLEDGRRLARRGESDGALAAYEQALSAAPAGALAALPEGLPAHAAASVLDLRRLDAMEALAAALVEAGALDRAGGLAREVTTADPLRERAVAVSMLALYRSGRQAEALRTYAALRRRLADELGADPSTELQLLHERMLLHDGSLLLVEDVGSRADRARNPYKGLRSFGEGDAPDFHGREVVVADIVERLGSGVPLVALVGPSGSGKSSLLAAGLLPALRAVAGGVLDGVRIVAPDRDAIQTGGLEAVLDDVAATRDRVVLVLDQFEELFSLEDRVADRLLDRLCALLSDRADAVQVVLALRADHYDRPLRHPGFAALFGEGVLTLLPMHPDELERAIAAPAARVGARVEHALLAALVADSTAGPAVLPLLQFVLTELFDHRTGGELTLADYRSIGGLRGALAREAEALRERIGPGRERLLAQLVLRMVRVDRAGRVGRRVVPVAELTRLVGVDTVAVGDVLGRLNELRLVTYEWGSGAGGTVEMSHEALVDAWPWLQDLVTRHSVALRRHAALAAAVAEWEDAGRDPGYLLNGPRLAEIDRWGREGVLALTTTERQFIASGLEQAEHRDREEEQRAARQAALERRSRRRLVLLAGAMVSVGALAALAVILAGREVPRVATVTHGSGVPDVLIDTGVQLAADETELTQLSRVVDAGAESDLLELTADEDVDLLVSHALDTDFTAVARARPDTWFLVLEREATGGNVTTLQFADQQTAYLAGAAAALATSTGRVGFLGGVDTPDLRRFEAGFVAGALAVDPAVEFDIRFATRPPDYSGFVSPAVVTGPAQAMLAEGADVIYVPAGLAQTGALQVVADAADESGRELWAIGADQDMYVDDSWQPTRGARDHVLTSTVKRFDLAVRDAVRDFVAGRLTSGDRTTDLASGGLSLAESGGHLVGMRPRLDSLRADILTGRIVVPCVPVGLTGEAAMEAAAGAGCPPS